MPVSPLPDLPNILPFNGRAVLINNFLGVEESNILFALLLKEVFWRQEPIIMFGKKIMQPRLTAWYADDEKTYSYSGIVMKANMWNTALLSLREAVEATAGVRFNSALLNLYRNGNDSMGWHRDNEKELGHNPVIASVSLGASRVFSFRLYQRKEAALKLELKNGSLLVMYDETQHYWEHALPKNAKVTEPRINITFRRIT